MFKNVFGHSNCRILESTILQVRIDDICHADIDLRDVKGGLWNLSCVLSKNALGQ